MAKLGIARRVNSRMANDGLCKLEISRTVHIKMGAWDVPGQEGSAVMTKISQFLVGVSILFNLESVVV